MEFYGNLTKTCSTEYTHLGVAKILSWGNQLCDAYFIDEWIENPKADPDGQ